MRRLRIGRRATALALGLAVAMAAAAAASGGGGTRLTLLSASGGPTSQIAVGLVAPYRTFERGHGGAYYYLRIQGPGACDTDGVANFADPPVEAGDEVVILATPDDLDNGTQTWCPGTYRGTVTYETESASGNTITSRRLGHVRWTIRAR